MRLAVSSIAWDVSEDEIIADLLRRHGVDAIDIAPGKYFPEPAKASDDAIRRVRTWWSERGIEITGMQALLFGTTGLNVFGAPQVRDDMLAHLEAVCRIGGGLGAGRLVFGSPKNRDRSGLSDAEAKAVAVPFFRRLGDIAASHGVVVCLEPNPECYGANFMTTSAATACIVKEVAHPAIRMQFDTGALTINAEDPDAVLKDFACLTGHVHLSEPDLVPLGDGRGDHARYQAALARHLPGCLATIEMVATKDETHPASVGRALRLARERYAPVPPEGEE